MRNAGPLERISIKLKRLTRALQSWSAKKVGHIKSQLALAREVLHRLEVAQDMRLLSPQEEWLRRELKRLFEPRFVRKDYRKITVKGQLS